MLPPQLQDDDGSDPQATIANLHQQLQQFGQQHQQMSEVLQKQTEMIHDRQIEQQGKLAIVQEQEASAVQQAKIKADTAIAVAEINTKAQNLSERMSALESLMADFHQSAHEQAMQAGQQAHEKDLATQAAASDQQSQSSDQGHDMVMAQQSQNGDGQQ
jgi:hypothetical protein